MLFRASFCRFILDSNLVRALDFEAMFLPRRFATIFIEVTMEAEDTERPTYHKSAESHGEKDGDFWGTVEAAGV